jgi:chromosome partitioning protein
MTDSFFAVVVAICSQKGGVGKSTIAAAMAAAAAREQGVRVRIIDADQLQETSAAWVARRKAAGIKPEIGIAIADRIGDMKPLAGDADVLIIDAPGRASRDTLTIARQAHLIIQPTAGSSADLMPGITLFRELEQAGIDRRRMVWALSRIDSEAEERELRAALQGEGWAVLKGCLFNRSAYKRAMDAGLSVTETAFPSLNSKAQVIIDSLQATLRQTSLDILADAQARTGSLERAA